MPQSRKIVVVLKGYPRLSETFIAQELLGLERTGFDLTLVAMRHPTDAKRHPVHDEIRAPVHYLPEYLYREPRRVLRGLAAGLWRRGFCKALRAFGCDLLRDPTPNRVRRFGQALVLANEWPDGAAWLHAHFAHTPASVTRYTSLLTNVPWTCSAHAKDIWTSPDWELTEKLNSARWLVTCTHTGYEHLRSLTRHPGRVHLSYHGLDLTRFSHADTIRAPRDGTDAANPVVLLSVGRAVEKKGYDILLRSLAMLPVDLHWRFEHIGGGEQLGPLKTLAQSLGIADRIIWKGALAQEDVLEHYRRADIFALACRIAANGDRDGLPNVLVEASSQNLVCISTNISGVPELLNDGENGLVVEPENSESLARALEKAIRDPALRQRLGEAAERRVRTEFDHSASIRQLKCLFEKAWRTEPI